MLLNLVFIFGLILSLLNFAINLDNRDYIKDKFIIFFSIFLFQIIIMVISCIINKCVINMYKILNDSLNIALISVIGYSVYHDLVNEYLDGNAINNYPTVTCTIIIILFITMFKTIRIMMNNNITC